VFVATTPGPEIKPITFKLQRESDSGAAAPLTVYAKAVEIVLKPAVYISVSISCELETFCRPLVVRQQARSGACDGNRKSLTELREGADDDS